jgi:hypothetical protein
MTNKGRTYELDMVRDITASTDPRYVWTTALDYSGGAADSDADIVVTFPRNRDETALELIELKKRGGDDGNRVIVMGGSGDETGRDELRRLVDAGPRAAESWFAVKFAHRKLVVVPSGWVWKQVAERPDELPTDYRKRNEIPSEAAQTYVRRTQWPYWWKPTEAHESLAPRLTDAGSLSMVKPSLDWWESSTAAQSDEHVLLEALNLPEQFYE